VVLLDALIHRLGEGLSAAVPQRPPSDEAEIGADEEEGGELTRKAPDYEVLAKACRGKVRRLINRMDGQLKRLLRCKARRAIAPLAAVLGVVRSLRIVEQRLEWRRRKLELIVKDDEWKLFEAAVLAVSWGKDALIQRAVAEAEGEWFEELSIVLGLLAWLAWEIEVDVEEPFNTWRRQGVERRGLVFPHNFWKSLSPVREGEGAFEVLEESGVQEPLDTALTMNAGY
jgi:hypothetical protein